MFIVSTIFSQVSFYNSTKKRPFMGNHDRKVFFDNLNYFYIIQILFNVENIGKISPSSENQKIIVYNMLLL